MSTESNMNISTRIQENNKTTELNESMQVGMDSCGMLRICLENFIENVSLCVSEQLYCEVLGKITKSKSVPGKVRNKIKTKLVHDLNDEVKCWIEEEKIYENIKKLDKIVEECPSYNNSKAWRPNGNVQDHMRSLLMAAKLKHAAAVEEYVKDRERATESRMEQVSADRSKVKALSRAIQLKSDSSSNYKALDSFDRKVMERVDVLFTRGLDYGASKDS